MTEPPTPVRILKVLFAFLAIATIAAALSIAARRARASAAAELPVVGQVPAFSMLDQHGRTVTDETLRGEVLVVDFFYATCTTSCPMLTGKMLAVQNALAHREDQLGRRLPVHLVSITLDPDNDTPDLLRGYAARVGADDDRWSFLSGRSDDLDRIVVRGFRSTFERADPAAGIGAIMHGEWLVLVDRTGALRGFYAASDAERMQALVTDAVHLAGEPERLAGPKTYHAAGVIKSFGPSRAFVNIAHEDIPGYMQAMTMSFEPQRPGLLDGLAEQDRVAFDFMETEDARRVLTRIDRRP
jgi:protein SCO1/2